MPTYTIRYLCNLAAPKFIEGYLPEHEVAEAGVIEEITTDTALDACERAFMYWNRDDRPNGRTAPSLSVGDVVHLEHPDGDLYYACIDIGFASINAPKEIDVEDGKTVADLIHERIPKKCVCGYPADNENDLDEHIAAMARAGSSEAEHQESR